MLRLYRCLAPLHGIDFVTPSIVALAAGKTYPHRLVIVSASNERSMQYGSDLPSVAAVVDEYTPDLIIEEVINQVEPPL